MTYTEFIEEWNDGEASGKGITASTSGSTGKPKNIILPRRLVSDSALRTIRHFKISDAWHLHSCISPDFIGGKMMAVRAAISGARLTWERPTNNPVILDPSESIPHLVSVVPSQMLAILRNKDLIIKIKDKTQFLIGGSSLHPELVKEIIANNVIAWESYGMTETASHIALRRVSITTKPFRPLEGIEISKDADGCLTIDLGMATPIHTHDLVEIYPDNSFRILGRSDNVIITGGKKVIPEEVEREIASILKKAEIHSFLITSEEDVKWGNRIILQVEKDQLSESEEAEMLEKMKQLLPHYKVPKKIRTVQKIPRTANGKILRHQGNNPQEG